MRKGTFLGVLLIAASLFLSTVAQAAEGATPVPGEDYPYIGPQTFEDHKYYYFGTPEFPVGSRQGISISLDASSVSYQSIKATVTMDWKLISDRQITMFYVLANGVKVDQFEPYFDRSDPDPEKWTYKEYYYIDINVSDQYIGSDNFFQVIGVRQGKQFGETFNDYVVAWSQQSAPIRFKPLPVTDSDTHGWLSAIYELLQQLKDMLAGKLDALKAAVEDIYKVKPETQQRFDNALAAMQQALPSQQVSEQMDEVRDMMDESKALIENGPNDLKFMKVKMFDMEFYFLDFTLLQDSVKKIRDLLALILWCEFFLGVIRLLVPKLTA